MECIHFSSCVYVSFGFFSPFLSLIDLNCYLFYSVSHRVICTSFRSILKYKLCVLQSYSICMTFLRQFYVFSFRWISPFQFAMRMHARQSERPSERIVDRRECCLNAQGSVEMPSSSSSSTSLSNSSCPEGWQSNMQISKFLRQNFSFSFIFRPIRFVFICCRSACAATLLEQTDTLIYSVWAKILFLRRIIRLQLYNLCLNLSVPLRMQRLYVCVVVGWSFPLSHFSSFLNAK